MNLTLQNLTNRMISAAMGKLLDRWDAISVNAGILGKPHVDKLRFYDLRHTCATNLARAGKDIKRMAQHLGHADVKPPRDIFITRMRI
jgi:integrase